MKKTIILLIIFTMALNIVLPTVALATNELSDMKVTNNNNDNNNENNGNTTNNIDNTNNNTNNDDSINNEAEDTDEDNNSVNEDIENNFTENENNSILEENLNTQTEQINSENTNTKIEEEIIGKVHIDTPTNETKYFQSETSNVNIEGWKMSNASDTYIKAYIDNKEINSEDISYKERQNVIDAITGYGTAEQNPKPGFSFNIDTSNLAEGTHTIKVELYSKDTVLDIASVNIDISKSLHVQYRTHVENEGWQNYVQDGEMAGTQGKAYRLEAINIQLMNKEEKNLNIKYQVHIQDIGWQDWKQNGEMAGTEGRKLRLEAIRIDLPNSEDYSVMYRVHIQDIGWQDWKTDGEMAGTTGQDKRLEAIEIKIVPKQKKGKINLDNPKNGNIYYSTETTSINVEGWKMANVSDTYIKAYIDNQEINSKDISYTEKQNVIDEVTGYGTAEQNPKPGFTFNIDTSNLSEGTHTIRVELYSEDTVLATTSVNINFSKSLHVQYRTHVENDGWQNYVQDGEMAGTEGKAYRLEAMNIQLKNKEEENINIKYQVHVQDDGWQEWKQNGEMAGTEGRKLRLEAIKIDLENTEEYSIMYRVHIQDIGWQDWKVDGEIAGTEGKSLRLEAIEIKIIPKQKKVNLKIEEPNNGKTYYSLETPNIKIRGWKMANVSNTYIKAFIDDREIDSEKINYTERQDVIQSVTNYGTVAQNPTPGFEFDIDISSLNDGSHTIKIEVWHKDKVLKTNNVIFYTDKNPHIKYQAHIEDIGWQDYVQDGMTAGTTGKSLEIEAVKIELVNVPETVNMKYRVYVQGSGWTDYIKDGEQAGTTGERKKIQAIQIEIEGLDGYVVEYQTHVENIGWQPWVINNMIAGSTQQSLGIEALNIRLVKEENSIVPQIKYSIHDESNKWTDYNKNGNIVGDTNGKLKIDAIKMALENNGKSNIKYRVHVQEIGWMDNVQNGEQAGTGDSINGIEAIEIKLDGLDDYSVEYRTYVIGKGWQAWVRDGQMSGTTGQNLQISAIQIKIVIKDDGRRFSNFSELDESKYPGYKQALEKLQKQHPNWIITIDYTGLDWNTVLDNEDQLVYDSKGNASAKSLTQYTQEWRSGDPKEYEPGWYRASRAAIAYMMDPRNSFDDEYIFQFQDLTSNAGTYQDIANMIKGTFLTRYTEYSTDSIINTILYCANEYKVSPFHLVSRMIQEQGVNGGPLNGYMYNGRLVYNLFNIGASNSATGSIIENGAAYAYKNHWFTPELCIEGSTEFLNSGYMSRGQITLYYQKYNVKTKPYYQNQYMTNIRGANDEGQRIGKEYKNNGLIDMQFEFKIPVYENMPASASPRPIGSYK